MKQSQTIGWAWGQADSDSLCPVLQLYGALQETHATWTAALGNLYNPISKFKGNRAKYKTAKLQGNWKTFKS